MREEGKRITFVGESQYIWNHEILKDFVYMGVSRKWTLPVIQGYVESDNSLEYQGKPLCQTLISRRKVGMAGTRYQARGVDENGKAANFVETELIMDFNGGEATFAHVQIRGSVPIFWKQKNGGKMKIIENVNT